jgi:hypothetical protein
MKKDTPLNQLTGSWNVLPAIMEESYFSTQLVEEIDREIVNEIRRQMLIQQGWHDVFITNWRQIPDGWCEKYIKGQYQCFGHFWYFEKLSDATFFTLKWK